jgi:hypothetical protein
MAEQMLVIFLNNWLSITLLTILAHAIHLYFLRRLIRSFFEPIHLHCLTASITIGMLFGMFMEETISLNDFLLFTSFFGAVILGLRCIKAKDPVPLKPTVCNAFEIKVIWLCSGISILATALIASIILLTGASGDDRLIIQKQLRFVDVIRQGGLGIAAPGLWYLVLIDQRRSVKSISIVFLITMCAIGLFSGSKSFLLMTIIPLFLLRTVITPPKALTRKLDLAGGILMAGAIAAVFFNYYFFRDGTGIDQSLILFADRIAATADAYDYAFRDGDITELHGTFEPIPYVLHPFLRMIGFSGYDYPLGAALFELRTGDNSGFGPNANLTLLVYLFFSARWPAMLVVGVALGAFIAWSRRFSYYHIGRTPEKPLVSIFPLCVFYLPAVMIYSDIGIFEHNLISIFVLTGISYLLAALLFPPTTSRIPTRAQLS